MNASYSPSLDALLLFLEQETVTSYVDDTIAFSNATNVLTVLNNIENKTSNLFDCFLNNYRKANLDKLNLLLTSKEETSIKIEGCIKKAAHPKNN